MEEKITVRGNLYTIEFKVWKEDKYGEPDIIDYRGEYFSEEAAIKDLQYIDSTYWYIGFARTNTKVVKKYE